jgi:hypothetical protein
VRCVKEICAQCGVEPDDGAARNGQGDALCKQCSDESIAEYVAKSGK